MPDVFLSDQRLDIETALTAYTRGSAFVNHLNDETGSIEVGKSADLVLLDQDLFAINPSSIANASVLLTLAGGRPVLESPNI